MLPRKRGHRNRLRRRELQISDEFTIKNCIDFCDRCVRGTCGSMGLNRAGWSEMFRHCEDAHSFFYPAFLSFAPSRTFEDSTL